MTAETNAAALAERITSYLDELLNIRDNVSTGACRETILGLLSAGAAKVPVHQFRARGCADWYDGHADHGDGGDWEERTLYATPPAPDAGVVEPPHGKAFAVVWDRLFEGGPSIAQWDGETYQFTDGDCFARDGDTLDGYTAHFFTAHELAKWAHKSHERGWAAAAGWAKRDDLIADIGSPAYIAEMQKGTQ